MCLNNYFYPLVKEDKNDPKSKQKILFDFPVVVDKDNLLNINSIKANFRKGLKGDSIREFDNHYLFKKSYEFIDLIKVPCGSCPECLKKRSLDIVFKLYFESKIHENNYFITFTYDDENCPLNLIKNEMSTFNKKLRTYLDRKGLRSDFKFYCVGEYGSKSFRPHYHGIYFGLDLPDLKKVCDLNAKPIFESDFLSNTWKKGNVYIGSVEVASICYVARYCDKKRLLSNCEKKELKALGVEPEFSVSSKKLGYNFFSEFDTDYILSNNRFFIKGQSFTVPRSFRRILKDNGFEFKDVSNDLLMIRDINNIYNNSKIFNGYFNYYQSMLKLVKDRKRGVI